MEPKSLPATNLATGCLLDWIFSELASSTQMIKSQFDCGYDCEEEMEEVAVEGKFRTFRRGEISFKASNLLPLRE